MRQVELDLFALIEQANGIALRLCRSLPSYKQAAIATL